jgi:hypothetical protein
MARARGLPFLHLAASLNAEAFYTKHGYSAVENSFLTLRDGTRMSCVMMRKDL